jgi:hypothetical protein
MVNGMTFHGNLIVHGTCNIVIIITNIQKRLITISKPKGVKKMEGNVENNIVPWFGKDITICKYSVSK